MLERPCLAEKSTDCSLKIDIRASIPPSGVRRSNRHELNDIVEMHRRRVRLTFVIRSVR